MIFSSVFLLLGIGFTAAVILAAASKVFHVEENPLISQVNDVLAGAQCGGCGYPGCLPAAKAVVAGKAGADVCVAGGQEVAEAVARVMGLALVAVEPKLCEVDCTGGRRAENLFHYEGVADCRAQHLLGGGAKFCPEGCLGEGTCVSVCPFDAIHMGPHGYPVVDALACRACNKCVEACPRGVLEVVGVSDRIQHLNQTTDCLAPCRQKCPGSINIPKYIEHISRGDYAGAVLTIKERIPLLLVCGRVCPRPCETECRRGHVDEPVAINMLKRFVADWEMNSGTRLPIPCSPDTGNKVAVIGGGPAGLSCAYFLRRLGHHPTIFESLPKLGGQLRFGIPEYRLPKEVLDWEIQGILDLGVDVKTGVKFGRDFDLKSLGKKGFKAVFLGFGAWDSREMGIEGEDAPGVVNGTEMLTRVGLGVGTGVGKRVVVVGGGNTAIDAARTSVRGGSHVTMMYRRTEAEMPAHAEEVRDAREEGVEFLFLAAPTRVVTGEDGHVIGLEYLTMELGEPDASGRRRPQPVPGSEKVFECDTIIPAIGQVIDMECLYEEGGECPIQHPKYRAIAADPVTLQTAIPNVFAGGDVVTGPNLVISAIGQGRKAARSISQYLAKGEIEKPGNLQTSMIHYTVFTDVPGCADKPRSQQPHLCSLEDRTRCFDEVEGTISAEQAQFESCRCLRCGLTCYTRDEDRMPEAEAASPAAG
ncbi:MAG: RnfABCDGE type electron transport complex subunit B [Desulfovibrionaceae bacterium]